MSTADRRRNRSLSNPAADVSVALVLSALGAGAIFTPVPWLAAMAWPLAIASVAVPGVLRRRIRRKENQLVKDAFGPNSMN